MTEVMNQIIEYYRDLIGTILLLLLLTVKWNISITFLIYLSYLFLYWKFSELEKNSVASFK